MISLGVELRDRVEKDQSRDREKRKKDQKEKLSIIMLGLKKSFIRNDFQHQQLDLARGEGKEGKRNESLGKEYTKLLSPSSIFFDHMPFFGPTSRVDQIT